MGMNCSSAAWNINENIIEKGQVPIVNWVRAAIDVVVQEWWPLLLEIINLGTKSYLTYIEQSKYSFHVSIQ